MWLVAILSDGATIHGAPAVECHIILVEKFNTLWQVFFVFFLSRIQVINTLVAPFTSDNFMLKR